MIAKLWVLTLSYVTYYVTTPMIWGPHHHVNYNNNIPTMCLPMTVIQAVVTEFSA